MSPLPPTRRGACPALTRPMETGDGLLVRLVPAKGALSPAQLSGLAAAARQFGNGLVEVTARGSLQLRGLTPETVSPLNAAVAALHITPREGLTTDVSPLCGVDPAEIADARPLAAALRAQVTGLAGRLGPKVSVVLDGGGAIGLDALSADIRLRAVPDAAGPAWELALAGDAAHFAHRQQRAAHVGSLVEHDQPGVWPDGLPDAGRVQASIGLAGYTRIADAPLL